VDWYLSLPPAEAQVSCGGGTHTVRWEAGRLELPAHPDAEAERVLSALGGDKARCVEAAETWDRHAEDLEVLVSGPRSVADLVTVSWDDAETHRSAFFGLPPGMAPLSHTRPGGPSGRGSSGPGAAAGPGASLAAGLGRSLSAAGGPAHMGKLGAQAPEQLRRAQDRVEVLQLHALGPAFQFRLAGAVTAAWAAGSRAGQRASRVPELTAALAGRAAPAIAGWLGIPPEAVMASPVELPTPASPSPMRSVSPWGSLDLLGTGRNRLVRASLPVAWLASVWACGLALVAGHLVVAVDEPGWPRARVLALPEPGAAPVLLDVIGTDQDPVPSWRPAAEPRSSAFSM
jgi:hypothetical protein